MIYRKGKSKKDADRIIAKWTERWAQNVVDYIRTDMDKNFARERHSDRPQGKWASLLPSTNRWRRWMGYSEEHPILFGSGRLKDAIKVVYDIGGGSQSVKVPRGKANKMNLGIVSVITDVEYSELLNKGLTGYKLGGTQPTKGGRGRKHLELPNKILNMEKRMELTNFNFYFNEMLLELRAKVYKHATSKK